MKYQDSLNEQNWWGKARRWGEEKLFNRSTKALLTFHLPSMLLNSSIIICVLRVCLVVEADAGVPAAALPAEPSPSWPEHTEEGEAP